ncbi:MAG: hypothetical protein J7M26_08000 [Armatimonadetes bacterium]|nr:hypothetical protein [Armatimonadota bacterium]
MLALLPLAAQPAPAASPDLDPSQNLALGKPVTYLPNPNYRLTARGGTDPTDLTDGQLTKRKDLHMWFEQGAVGWSYPGRVNLAVDLCKVQPVDEVAIRWLGGSPQAGICMPGWVEVFVADRVEGPYYKVAEFSRWLRGYRELFPYPRYEGKAWVYRMRFTGLHTRARCVGLRFYGAGLTCSDEMYVFRGDHDPASVKLDPATISDFTVTQAELHLHKPLVYVTSNIVTPIPIGMVAVRREKKEPLVVNLTFPQGVRLVGGQVGGVEVTEADRSDNADKTTTYIFALSASGPNNKTFGRLYAQGKPVPGAPSEVRYSLQWADYRSPEQRCPLKVIEVPDQPKLPKRLMTSLSWWPTQATMEWPEWDRAFHHLGFNTVTAFSTWFNPAKDRDIVAFLDQARAKGYKVQAIDSTWHRMLSRCKNKPEIYCQFEDGTHGTKMCPSYRGSCYQAELKRVADAVKLLKPNYLHCDIELWGWRGPVDSEKCTRCLADKKRSGIEDWAQWRLSKGEEMWIDLYRTVQEALREVGAPPCEMAVYDFRPGEAYQYFWPFDRLYPKYMQTSQVSTYTPLEPYHIELVGNEVRRDRQRLPRSDQMPWITPGDAGTFPGRAFYYALLEIFCNGSRGVNFWSGRLWDADYLAAYARAVRDITPVEDVIVDGDLYPAQMVGPGRASAMKHGDEIVLLVADYHGDSDGLVRVRLKLRKSMRVRDLDTGKLLGKVGPGEVTLPVELGSEAARLLYLCP